MQLRTFALACALLAAAVAPRDAALRAPPAPRGPDLLTDCEQQPWPFLGSGGVVVQVPVTQPVTVSPLLRIDGCGRLPAINVAAGRPGQRGAALPQSGRGASIRACHLGTPPPHSLSSRAGCPARPIQA